MDKLFKEHIKYVGSNISQRAVTKINVTHSFLYMKIVTNRPDQQRGMHSESPAHSIWSYANNVMKIMSTILKEKLLDIKKGRKFKQ